MSKRTDYLDNIISGNQEANKSDRQKYLDRIIENEKKNSVHLVKIEKAESEPKNSVHLVKIDETATVPRSFSTSPVQAKNVYAPTLEEERANERDKLLTPSVSRQAGKTMNAPSRLRTAEEMALDPNASAREKAESTVSLGERIKNIGTGAIKQYAGSVAEVPSLAVEQQKGTLSTGALKEQVRSLDSQIAALEKTLSDPTMTAKDIAETNEALRIAREQRKIYGDAVNANEETGSLAREAAQQLTAAGAEDIEKAQKGLGWLGKVAVQAGAASVQMGVDATLGLATGGGTMAPMVFRSFGNGVQAAAQKGYNANQQIALGITTAATEYFTEKLFGGNPVYDTDVGLINKLVGKIAGNGKLMTALNSMPAEMLSEGIEEIIADILEPTAEYIITGKRDFATIDEIIADGATGVLMSVIGVGGQKIGNSIANGGGEKRNTQRTPLASAETAYRDKETDSGVISSAETKKPSESVKSQNEVERLSGTFGENGAKAFRASFDRNGDSVTVDAYGQFAQLYNEGKNRAGNIAGNVTAEIVSALSETPALLPEQRFAAFASGVNDGKAAVAKNETTTQEGGGAQAGTLARFYEERVAGMTGENGGKAFVERYDGTQDIAEYTAGFVRYWNAGATGRKIGSVQNTGGLNELQRYAAYYAGQNDAARSTVSEQSGVKDVAINARRGLSSDGATARNTAAWSDELRGTVDALGRKLGVLVVVDDTFEGVSANGYYDAKTNEIHLAKDSENPVLQVVRHEATHRMQQLSPKEYRAFRDYAVRMAGEDAVEEKRQAYSRGRVELSEEEAMDEIAAETAEKLLTDETAISDFIRENRTAAQKFYDALRSVVQKVKEALGADQTLAQAERLWKSAFEKADAQAQENAANKNAAPTDNADIRFSIKTDSEGRELSAQQQEYFKDSKVRNKNGYLRPVYHYTNEKFTQFERRDASAQSGRTMGDGYYFSTNPLAFADFGKYEMDLYANVKNPFRMKMTKAEANNVYDKYFAPLHNDRFGTYRPHVINSLMSPFKVIDYLKEAAKTNGTTTSAILSELGYDGINNGSIEWVAFDSNQLKSVTNAAPTDNADIRFSIKTDSEGRELSEQQQEYFQDSKSVDTDGRLKVMYQGGNGDFTVFDRKKSKGSNLYGRGFYFTDSEAQAKQYGGTRAFYLNVTNPLTPGQNSITRQQMRDFLSAVAENEDYGLENYGYGATVDSVLESVYGKGDFEMLQDVNATAIGDLVAAADLFNEVNGTDYDGIILPTETVTFRSNQAKNVTNAAPTDNADIRFSLKAPVEETDDLIAVHNLTEKNLTDALDLGGLPMPSIAVVKAKNGHSKYGPISLVFGKDTIDPRITSANRVYGGDAYTATAPSIGYKIDYDVMKSIRDKLHSVLDDETYNAMHFHIDTDNLTDALKRNGGDFKQAYGRDRGMRLAFLKDTGKELRIPKKDVKYEVDTPALREIIKKFDVDSLYEMGYQGFEQNEPEVRKALFDYTVTSKDQTVLDNGKTIAQVKAELTYGKKLPFSYYYNIIEDARKIKHNGVEKEVDTTRLDTRIAAYFKSKKTQAEYEAWLDDLSRGIVAKKGIRNNADPYTRIGNRRSFEALYDDYTLSNIVKAMKAGQEERGNQFFGASATTLQSVTTPSYGSIAEIKADSGRLARYDDETYEAMKKEIDDELFAVINEIYDTTKHWSDNQFTEYDSIAEAMVNAARRGGTADAIVRSFKRDGYSINGDVAQRLKDLYRRSADLPTEYFEAKPRRAVEFDEVRAVVAPKNLDPALKQRLEDEGIKVISYKTGDDADRTKKLNSIKDVRFSLRDNSPEAVAAKQQEMIEYLRGQLRRSRGVTTKKGDVAKIARATAKAWDSSADVTERLQAMYDFMANGKDANGNELTWDDLWSEAKSIAGDMLGESMTRNDDLYREYADLRRTVRDTKLNVPKELDGDLDVFGGYGEFRRGEGRALNLSRSEGTGIDDFFQTLADSYPEYFDEALTSNPADQLARIAEVMNDLKPVYENRFAGDEQAVNYLADELINSFYDARQEAPTFADKAALDKQESVAKVKNAARDKMQTREAKLRSAYDERIAKMREMNRQKIEERMSKLREQRDNRIASLKQHYKEAEEARRNQKRDSEARTRLLNIARRLNNKKLPAVSKSLIQQYIGELDLTAKSMTGATLERLTDLQAWYADQKETNPDFISDPSIEKALQRLSKKQIADLTADEVSDLTNVLLNIENEIRTQRKLIDSQVRRDAYLAGDAAITDIENSKGSSGGKVDTFLLSETLSPMREMHRITGYVDNDPLYVVTQELADGQRKMFDYQRRANERFKEWVDDKEFIKTISGKDAKEITITGIGKDGVTSVKITPAMRMSLYLHSRNDQNLRHIAGGGITVPDIKLYKKGNIVEAYNKGKTIKLKPSEVLGIVSGMSEKELAFARAAHGYYNGQSQSEINSTSERLKGYSVATVGNYFPMDTDKSFLKKEFDSIKRDGTIEGMGFLKERIDAANPIMLYDMNSVLTKSINQHSKYVGLAIPVRNFSKLWGVTTGSFNEDGSRSNFESSVQKAVKEKWGQNGYDYIEQMMADLNNVSGGQKSWGKALASARSAYAGAVLELNASVAVKQAASYPTAASVVGFKPLIKALGDTSKINTEQIARYTPLLWYRSQGYSSQELGELAQRGKSLPKALNWIQAIDVATTTKLWKAAEYYVRDTRKDLERASEAYYREVANVYNRIIEETQPNYTTMQRPAILRSDNELVRTLNMFKTQPFQNFNILYDGIENMNVKRRAYESDGSEESRKAYNEAKTAAARAITSQAVSSFVFALMQYAWDAFRGKDDKYKDEDDEYSIGTWLKAMGFNMLTNGFGMFPFGSEVLEAAETLTDKIATTLGKDPVFDATYYGVDVSVVDTVNNTVNDSINGIVQTIATIQTAAEDDKKVNWESYARTMYKVIVDYAQLAGVPIDNVRKTAVAVAQQAFKAANGKYVGGYYALRLTSDPAKYSGDYYDLLYKAYKTDRKSYEEVFGLMVDSGSFATDKIKNAMETRMKEDAGVKNVKDLAQRYYTPEQQKRYDTVMRDVQKSAVWKDASAEQRKALENDAHTYLAGSGDDAQQLTEKIAEGAKYDVSESDYLLYMLALEMADKPNKNGELGGNPTNDEKEEALRMLTGISDKERSYLWTASGGSDANNPWK